MTVGGAGGLGAVGPEGVGLSSLSATRNSNYPDYACKTYVLDCHGEGGEMIGLVGRHGEARGRMSYFRGRHIVRVKELVERTIQSLFHLLSVHKAANRSVVLSTGKKAKNYRVQARLHQ